MTSDQMVSVSPIWQLGHVGKGPDVFAKPPFCQKSLGPIAQMPECLFSHLPLALGYFLVACGSNLAVGDEHCSLLKLTHGDTQIVTSFTR